MSSESMPRFANMLQAALKSRGHTVDVWSPKGYCYRIVAGRKHAKWAGYIDQYLIFPIVARWRLLKMPGDTLFVFCDQALGPWVPLVESRPHVVHVHDLLALRSALGHYPENPTSFTGRVYQKYIRRGFRRGRHFISVSKKTKADLHEFGGISPVTSEVVYNGLNYPYAPMPTDEAIRTLGRRWDLDCSEGILLHVGGNQWYKNLAGVIGIYAKYCSLAARPLPLMCVSPAPNVELGAVVQSVPVSGRIFFAQGIDGRFLQAAYTLARALIFPSLAEGFGWPLVEAQACGCPVITTDDPPMTEVAGPSAVYLPRLNYGSSWESWVEGGAARLVELLGASPVERADRRSRGMAWSRKFDAESAIARYLAIYAGILATS